MERYYIAELTVGVNCEERTLKKRGIIYRTESKQPCDILIDISDDKYDSLLEKHTHLNKNELEYIYTGFEFANYLLNYDGFCLHSSAVAVDQKAVLFSAPSGTGKSTHTKLWQKHFGEDKAIIINDDKPALRIIEDKFYVYGTPWSGKTDQSVNTKVPLQAIVFLEQAPDNYISRMSTKEAIKMVVYQSIHSKKSPENVDKLLSIIDKLVIRIPIYKMGCNISTDAVKMVYEFINNKIGDEIQ